ncbi:MAG TPA: hypothetical protein VKQ32_10705 [Polyangia bacterium]|nr:hypothetical protein [Polyangia bacterium]
MKDPKLLGDEGATDFERRWLSAARAEEPPPEVVSRIERALGIGAGAVPASVPADNTATATVAKGGLSALRIAGLSALGAGGVVGLALLLSRPAPAPPPVVAPPRAVETAPAVATPPVQAPAAAASVLRDEIALIDGARAALAAGSPAQALTLLKVYLERHPHGTLLPEALAMRVEAIDRTGDHARARALARAFLADYPNSPLAQRLGRLGRPEEQ